MPTLEFISLQKDRGRYPPVMQHGYDSSFFTEIEELFDTLEREEGVNRDEREKITTNLLSAGPCPGSARVYHTFASSPNFPGRYDDVSEVLGKEVDFSKRELGNKFEDWVDDANQAFNRWLETRDYTIFEDLDIPEKLRDFYVERAEELEEKHEDLEEDWEQFQMEVQSRISTSLFHDSTPDGAWISVDDYSGGVFESKVSLPPDPIDEYALSGYAANIEKAKEKPIEFGVFLYLDEDLEELRLKSFFISDVLRQSIQENLEIFSNLAFQSISKGEWEQGDRIVDRLVEPEEPKYDSPCKDCIYEHECHHYGKYEETLINSYNDISNLKLSGAQVLPLLRIINDEGPRRADIASSIMENYFPDKSEKSVFRGMVIPTLKRLHLIRMGRDGKEVRLSPNGRFVFSGDSRKEAKKKLRICIRDYILEELNISKNLLRYADAHQQELPSRMDEMTPEDQSFGNLTENLNRLRRDYIDNFGIELPDENQLLGGRLEYIYPGDYYNYLNNEETRKELIEEALPKNRQVQVDQARSRLIDAMLERGLDSSSWFTDEVLWKEKQHSNPCIKLWEGSKHDRTKIIRNSVPYDGILRLD